MLHAIARPTFLSAGRGSFLVPRRTTGLKCAVAAPSPPSGPAGRGAVVSLRPNRNAEGPTDGPGRRTPASPRRTVPALAAPGTDTGDRGARVAARGAPRAPV